ncbi:MAG: ABC transporter ATP-binding protein [Myxococcales bacterium]|nr:ABC transporter ATP-binding protein [Myxococcales bacterium]
MGETQTVLDVRDLHKTFRLGFFRKRVDAVRGIDFSVRDGEIFGLLGPNGAGKTTTIKMILGLIFPTQGEIRVFGRDAGDRESKKRIGYMPENPYVYQYLRPAEFLDLCGRLMGMPGNLRRQRTEELIDRVGLRHAIDRPVGRFSKGMTQRIGLAQALLHDPEVLILDEPMSGLDPVGRKEIRDLLLEQRKAGKTLIFTSHILSDVEMLCDRVTILARGKVIARGQMHELLRPEVMQVDVEFDRVTDEAWETIRKIAHDGRRDGARAHFVVEGEDAVTPVLDAARPLGLKLIAVTPKRETLEDLFVRDAMRAHDAEQGNDEPPQASQTSS